MSKFLPHEVIITFDLHGVLFFTDYPQFMHILWNSPHLWTFILHACRPTVWYRCIQLWLSSSPFERYMIELTTHWPKLAPCRQTLIALANCQKPHQEMITLVQKLKAAGYELHIFSNIGTIILNDLTIHYPEILGLFDHIFTTNAQIDYLSKRNLKIFKLYLESINSKNQKRIIFIDDCPKNNIMGTTHGMIAINAKSSLWVQERLALYIHI